MPTIQVGSIIRWEDWQLYGIGRVTAINQNGDSIEYIVDAGGEDTAEYPVYPEEISEVWNIGTTDKE